MEAVGRIGVTVTEKSYLKDQKGNITHIRETATDGRTSKLYEFSHDSYDTIFRESKGKLVEVTEHHEDGTTDAFEPDESSYGQIFGGGKGKHK
jgi:hypothetical protein